MRKNKNPKGAPTWPEDELVPKKTKEAEIKTKEDAETMKNEEAMVTAEDMSNKNKQQAEADRRQALVPPEEREVMLQFKKEDLSIVLTENEFENYIPPAERVQPSTESNVSYKGARAVGLFSEAIGMGQIKGALNDTIYAGRMTNSEGIKGIAFCQQYDGINFTPRLFIGQADLISLHMMRYEPEKIKQGTEQKEMSKILFNLKRQYLNTVSLECIGNVFDIKEILALLFVSLNDLPTCKEAKEIEAIVFYENIKEKLEQYDIDRKQSYYVLEESGIANVARSQDMTPKQLIRKLEYYNLLFHQNSNDGYQAKIRFFGGWLWAYCVFRLEYFDEVIRDPNEEKEVEDIFKFKRLSRRPDNGDVKKGKKQPKGESAAEDSTSPAV